MRQLLSLLEGKYYDDPDHDPWTFNVSDEWTEPDVVKFLEVENIGWMDGFYLRNGKLTLVPAPDVFEDPIVSADSLAYRIKRAIEQFDPEKHRFHTRDIHPDLDED